MRSAFNRTIVELKLICFKAKYAWCATFNRTIVELKQKQDMRVGDQILYF